VGESRLKLLASLKARIEKRISELEQELSELKVLIHFIDEVLSKESFVPASELKRVEVEERPVVEHEVLEKPIAEHTFTARTGEKLAKMIVYKNYLVVKPLIKLHVSTPPFRHFLLNRLLLEMRSSDEEKVQEGLLDPDLVIDYEIKTEDDVLKELIIRNYRERRRLDELRGAIRWTLARMYEKEYPS